VGFLFLLNRPRLLPALGRNVKRFGFLAILTMNVTGFLAILTMNVTGFPFNAMVVNGCILPGLMSGIGMTAIILPMNIGNPVKLKAIGNPAKLMAIMRLNAQPTLNPVQATGQATYVLQSPAKVITIIAGILVIVEGGVNSM